MVAVATLCVYLNLRLGVKNGQKQQLRTTGRGYGCQTEPAPPWMAVAVAVGLPVPMAHTATAIGTPALFLAPHARTKKKVDFCHFSLFYAHRKNAMWPGRARFRSERVRGVRPEVSSVAISTQPTRPQDVTALRNSGLSLFSLFWHQSTPGSIFLSKILNGVL